MGKLAPEGMPGGQMLPEFYNSLFTMHATIMIFFAIMPILIGAFGNFVVPDPDRRPRHGVPDAQHALVLDGGAGGGHHHLVVLRDRRRGAVGGWTSYAPLSVDPAAGPDALAALAPDRSGSRRS